MPHLIVKMYAGRSEEQKRKLAHALTRTLVETLGSAEKSVPVAIEDVSPSEWAEKVYRPDILDRPDGIYKQPGYDPFA